MPQEVVKVSPRALERRRHQRVKVVLLGRFMLENRQEFPCQTINISPGGLILHAPIKGRAGERVVIYLEHLGRVEGQISRMTETGFAITLTATRRKQDKLASQLTWLANRHELGLPEDRRHERIQPRNAGTQLVLADGRSFSARIIDVSLSGAALSCSEKPALGSAVSIGETPAKVVRHFEGGIAVEFLRVLPSNDFSDTVRL